MNTPWWQRWPWRPRGGSLQRLILVGLLVPLWALVVLVVTVQVVPPGLHSFSNRFGHQFDEAELLRLCSSGPAVGKNDLTADIKLIWDFSRAHPLFLNLCVSRSEAGAGAGFLRRWLKANENTSGPAWTCAMDVAIRAVNWIAADAISDGALGRKFGRREWSEWLWRHGAIIWRRLESRTNPSNHYLADLIRLIPIGAIFPNDKTARRWGRFAEQEFPQALLAQTHADGGLNEASLRYHAFVTEMALVARIFAGRPFPPAAEERIGRMCQVLADFRDAHGDVFPLGDDDSGRILALDHASTPGRADVLLKLAEALFAKSFSARPLAMSPLVTNSTISSVEPGSTSCVPRRCTPTMRGLFCAVLE